ncbi:MAG: hypothetical protein ABEJ30_02030 [Halorientalis sp.]
MDRYGLHAKATGDEGESARGGIEEAATGIAGSNPVREVVEAADRES